MSEAEMERRLENAMGRKALFANVPISVPEPPNGNETLTDHHARLDALLAGRGTIVSRPAGKTPTDYKPLDRVRLGNGQTLIIVALNPERPANKYSGILERGQGKDYIFGDKHNPVFLGTVTEEHPAVQRYRASTKSLGIHAQLVAQLVSAVRSGNTDEALRLANDARAVGY